MAKLLALFDYPGSPLRIDEYQHIRYGAERIGVQAGVPLPAALREKDWLFSLTREATEIENEQISRAGYFRTRSNLGKTISHNYAPDDWSPEDS
jgi:hypothetical protein